MKKLNWKAAGFGLVYGAMIALPSYICGHTTCAHQHATSEEQTHMIRDENGSLNYKRYIINAFKDYRKVQDDPLGLKNGLD